MNVSSHFEKYGERYLVSSLCQLLQLLVFFSHEHALLAFSLSYVLIFLVLPCDTESFQQDVWSADIYHYLVSSTGQEK